MNKKDVKSFMDFLNQKNYWLHIFKPTIDGIYQEGEMFSLFSADRKEIEKKIKEFDGKGIICLAINEREPKKTKGDDVKEIQNYVFDIDVKPEMKVDYVSTQEQHKYALEVARKLIKELEDNGFSVGMVVDSGNGAHIYGKIKLDLTNREEVLEKLTGIEKYMQAKFNDEIIKIDCITKDINRRMKIPGTINKKDTLQKENRVAKIIYTNNIPLPIQEDINGNAFKKFDKVATKQKTMLNCATGKVKTATTKVDRSAFEFGKVCEEIKKGKSKEQVFESMKVYSKWCEKPESYRELTFKKAAQEIEEFEINKSEEEKLRPLDFRSLMDYKVEPVSWLIENIIPKEEVGILAGKRGDAKTWLADRMALSLASGKPIFNEEVSEKKKVFIIDEEGGDNNQSLRMQLLAKGMDIEEEEMDLMSMSFSGLKLDDPNSPKFLEFIKILDSFQPDLIIVDCLQRVVSIDIDKENAQISAMFTGVIRPLIKKYHTSFLFIHHLRKSPTGNNHGSSDPLDEIRGGSEVTNYSRFVQSVSRPKNQDSQEDGSMMLVFKILKMSNAPIIEPKVLIFQPDSPDQKLSTQIKIDYLGKVEDVLSTEVRVANAIKEFILEEGITGEFKTKQIKEAEKKIGYKKTWLSKGLRELLESGFLVKIKLGVYKVSGSATPVLEKRIQSTLETQLPFGSSNKSLAEPMEGQK